MIENLFPLWLMIVCCFNVVERPVHSRIITLAEQYVGHKETSHNSSAHIDHWNTRIGLPLRSAYCASFVSFVLDSVQAAYPVRRTGLAQNFITRNSIDAINVIRGETEIPPGYIVVWKRGNSIFGHTAFVYLPWKGSTGYTIEANTTAPGASGQQFSGDGIYIRNRSIITTAFFRITHFTPTR